LTKNWVYDLIQGDNKTIFVAEIQGPEDQKDVKLRRGILPIKRGYNFAKIFCWGQQMTSLYLIAYRNGVLSLRIQML
jgi:hypothetical protein